jgi:hypothetical protein
MRNLGPGRGLPASAELTELSMHRLAPVLLATATALGACATHPSETAAKKQVDAVVVDEQARQEAAKVARQTGDSKDAVKAAADVSTREPATRPQ